MQDIEERIEKTKITQKKQKRIILDADRISETSRSTSDIKFYCRIPFDPFQLSSHPSEISLSRNPSNFFFSSDRKMYSSFGYPIWWKKKREGGSSQSNETECALCFKSAIAQVWGQPAEKKSVVLSWMTRCTERKNESGLKKNNTLRYPRRVLRDFLIPRFFKNVRWISNILQERTNEILANL